MTTKLGSAQHELWENWGPARRASLYLSLDDRLVVLGGGGLAEMFDVSRDASPRWIPYEQRPKESGDDWEYLRAAVDGGVDELTFYPPSVQTECIPLYGAGSSAYRKSHQDERSCAKYQTFVMAENHPQFQPSDPTFCKPESRRRALVLTPRRATPPPVPAVPCRRTLRHPPTSSGCRRRRVRPRHRCSQRAPV